jgi:integrase
MAGLYRRGGVYWGRAQRQGREYRRSLKTADRAIAGRRLRAWLDELDAVAWGDKPRRTFEEAAERFIREHLTTLKPGGAKRYGVSLKNLAPHFAGLTLDKITRSTLSDFETKRRSDGVAAGTIRRDFACLSSMLTSAEDWEWIEDRANPVPGYLRRRAKRGLKEAPARTRYLTATEEATLLAHATDVPRDAIVMAIDTGLRREKLFSLRWLQIDTVRGIIATTTRTKNGRARKVPLPQRSAQILAQLPRYLDCPYVFVNPDTRSRYVALEKGLKAAMRRAQITDLRWHDLRRTAGCRWLQRDGKSMEEVSILLGHSSVTVTEKCYAFLEADAVTASLGHTKAGTGTADQPSKEKSKQRTIEAA